jgi:propionate CoA-transferase
VKICSANDAVALVDDGQTILIDGSGGGVNEPDLVLAALEQRFLRTGHPRDLTVVHVSGMGDGRGGGIDHLAHRGMVRRVIGGHWAWARRMQQLARDEEIEAYCLPQGTLSHLLRDIAARRPGCISAVGLETCIDPRQGGGRLNHRTTEDIVHIVELDGKEWLFVPAFPIDVTIIRGSYADTRGNLTMEKEGLLAETLSAAQAARASGGRVIAQVKAVVQAGSIDPRRVRVPGVLIDAVVVHPHQRLSAATDDSTYLTGEHRMPRGSTPPMPLTVRKVIARRAAQELRAGNVVNLGFGMPDGVAAVLAEEGVESDVTFTLEQGHVGGIPATGSDFGLCINAEAMLDSGHQFDWYDGGGIDVAILSFAQVDPYGNVNVSRFGDRIAGVGGFVNISQGARRVVFVGTLSAKRSYEISPEGTIRTTGSGLPKFVDRVDEISFSATRALRVGQSVTYVTEKAVFRLTPDGLMLTEIAPGLDPFKDVVTEMRFTPKIATPLKEIDVRCYREAPMNLKLSHDDWETVHG